MKILILDDSKTIRKLIMMSLVSNGFAEENIVDFENGYDAIKYLNTNHDVRLMFLDIEMPGMDGLEFIKVTKSYVKTHKIKVIIVSGTPNKIKIKTALEHGAEKFIPKPVNPQSLMHLLRPILDEIEQEDNKRFQNLENITRIVTSGVENVMVQSNGYLIIEAKNGSHIIVDINKGLEDKTLKVTQ